MTDPSPPRQWVRSIKGKARGAIGYIVQPVNGYGAVRFLIQFPELDHPRNLIMKASHTFERLAPETVRAMGLE